MVGKPSLVPRPSPAPVIGCLQYFCVLQAIKNWSWGRPAGNKASLKRAAHKQFAVYVPNATVVYKSCTKFSWLGCVVLGGLTAAFYE